MSRFEVTMRHSEKTFEDLAHMQYDLFCKGNRVARSLLSVGVVVLGIMNYTSWWGILLVAYGCYLTTSTYSSANHTAHKLTKQIKASGMEFPASRYVFEDKAMKIIPLPEGSAGADSLPYSGILRLGEDLNHYYLFISQAGGYMVPKAELGERQADFRAFIEGKTGQSFRSRLAPVFKIARRFSRKKRA